MSSADVRLRQAQDPDFVAIAKIHEYYVLNTVITFSTSPSPASELAKKCHAILAQGLPYIVAVDGNDSVLGYTYVSGFRGAKGG
jgi:L-amino acid N-acyltransferase YncA